MSHLNRRQFLRGTAGVAACLTLPAPFVRANGFQEKLAIGVIGVANRGAANLGGVAGENIVALCDIDENYLAGAKKRFEGAKTYVDFRELLSQPGLDAVVISTPDHTHAPAAAAALRNKLDVYCEKPLTHSVREVQLLRKLARENGAVTQMGTQIHAGGNYRRVAELVRSGAIGPVSEVHVICNKSWSGGERPTDTPPVPGHIHYDLWLGPAPERPYHPAYLPGNWRRWWDFGGGTLADMACHYVDLPHWALELTTPVRVSAEGPEPHPETTPKPFTVHWEHPAKGNRPALTSSWYDGGARPEIFEKLGLGDWHNGVLFVGEKGWIVADYGRWVIGPEERFKGFEAPKPTIPDSIGHYHEWIKACKERGETTCNFDYSGPLTETVLLGNVAFRAGEAIEWDSEACTAKGSEAAQRLIEREYREGWTL